MAFGVGFDRDSEEMEDLAQINIIPLVDIMLVLLITFMIAAPLSVRGINVNLPSTRAKGQNVDGSKVILSIDQKGDFYFDKVKIPQDKLQNRLKAVFATHKEKHLYIRADKGVIYGKVIDAMGAAKMAGVDKIAMLTSPPNTPEKM